MLPLEWNNIRLLIEWRSHPVVDIWQTMEIDLGCLYRFMPHEGLQLSEVTTGDQIGGGESMPERVGSNTLGNASPPDGRPERFAETLGVDVVAPADLRFRVDTF